MASPEITGSTKAPEVSIIESNNESKEAWDKLTENIMSNVIMDHKKMMDQAYDESEQ